MTTDDSPSSPPAEADVDPQETREWRESLASVLERDGAERARFLLETLLEEAGRAGAAPQRALGTPYVNTLGPDREPPRPGDSEIEDRILRLVRWNAMAMVVRGNEEFAGLGGHIATYASAAHLYEMGLNHFWRAPRDDDRGDMVYVQGHSSPGLYARAFLEGRLTEDHLGRFRREVEPGGLSSYPHPWLMGDFWQFATVSMGLGPIQAIYQARFAKYLANREMVELGGRKVWAFLGDGETDEPESLGALSIAARERLDNLVFVVNCNLQRLDGPVRGNGKIIQELERIFRGAGWNVIKVVWGSAWDSLLARDSEGALVRRMGEWVDGDYQNYNAKGPAYLREHFFDTPELARLVEDWSDEQLASLSYGGHDPQKVHAAFAAAAAHRGQPTVILAKTIKGFGLGAVGQGQNPTHNLKKLESDDVREFRERFQLPISAEEAEELPFYRPGDDSPEVRYLKERREALGGFLPSRITAAAKLPVPGLDAFQTITAGSGEREISTTMAFVQCLRTLTRAKGLKEHLVPIVADESRTFGMEGLFRPLGIYAPGGQRYTPVDADNPLAPYTEKADGQILQEGISEAGAMSSWIAAATSYANHGVPMVPFFIFYSMFGFQRIGDLAWAAGDMQARGFLIGATSGRTTLNGEGLQHQDGHSHLLSSTVPNCVSYDPTYAYELAVILQDGLRRMAAEQENVFYYVTVTNENYQQPALPEGAEEGILKGMYRIREGSGGKLAVRLLGCGTILREVEEAAQILEDDHGVSAEVWSVTSFTELRRDGLAAERWNRLHPGEKPRTPYVAECLAGDAPVIASTDYMKTFSDQVRAWVQAPYTALGTDGFGRSDTREQLRSFFEVDRRYVVAAALKALSDRDSKAMPAKKVAEAIASLKIDPDKPEPTTV